MDCLPQKEKTPYLNQEIFIDKVPLAFGKCYGDFLTKMDRVYFTTENLADVCVLAID